MLMYLADKYNRFLPSDPKLKAEIDNWIMWQMGGQGPMTGNFGHFFVYAPADKGAARDYGVARYGMFQKIFLYVCICIYYIFACLYIFVYKYIFKYVFLYTYTDKYLHIYLHTNIFMNIYIYIYINRYGGYAPH
jgi:hypothetical protein